MVFFLFEKRVEREISLETDKLRREQKGVIDFRNFDRSEMSLDLLTVIVDANPCWWGNLMEETGDKDVSCKSDFDFTEI